MNPEATRQSLDAWTLCVYGCRPEVDAFCASYMNRVAHRIEKMLIYDNSEGGDAWGL